jgi:hypothetical protein
MRRVHLEVAATFALAFIVVGFDCGGGNSGGGESSVASYVDQHPCNSTQSPGYTNEVASTTWPPSVKYCPVVLARARDSLYGHGVVDADLIRHGGPLGWEARAAVYSVHKAGLADALATSQAFFFSGMAPYVDNLTGTQPARGQFDLVWTAGLLSTTGRQETDSVTISWATNNSYGGSYQAAAFVNAPIVISSAPGNLGGYYSVAAGSSNTWRVTTAWDTTGYNFQWLLDGSPIAGATGAQVTTSIQNVGMHSLGVNQTIADGTVLFSSMQVNVPLLASISGPTMLDDGTPTGQWTANVPAGVPPYAYSWTFDGNATGVTGSTYSDGYFSAGSHTIAVHVSDSGGHSTDASIGVYESTGCGGSIMCSRSPVRDSSNTMRHP